MLEVGTKLMVLDSYTGTGLDRGVYTVIGPYYGGEDACEVEDSEGKSGYGVKMDWIREGLVDIVTAQPLSLNDLCSKLHQENFQAGWWNDINTGEDMRSNVYFQTSKLLLVHSELSEATEALRKGLMDDKLPQYPGEAVELVDALIRIFDYCGMKGYDVDAILKAKAEFNAQRSDHKVENRGKQGGKLF